jgi:hypothetical protein
MEPRVGRRLSEAVVGSNLRELAKRAQGPSMPDVRDHIHVGRKRHVAWAPMLRGAIRNHRDPPSRDPSGGKFASKAMDRLSLRERRLGVAPNRTQGPDYVVYRAFETALCAGDLKHGGNGGLFDRGDKTAEHHQPERLDGPMIIPTRPAN